MSRYRAIRPLGSGPDGPVEVVVPDRLGGEPLVRRRAAVPAGPRRHRLRDLAESLARLGHPGIATVVDVEEVDDHHVDVVTTLGTDGSLADRLERGPVPADEVRRLLAAVADALAAAHGAGVAHGHVAASNIVLRGGQPLLTDFGIAEARTGHAPPGPFRRDVRDLATLGSQLLDPHDRGSGGDELRALLHWVGDDPDATLDDLRRGLGHRVEPPPPPPPPAPAPLVPVESADRRLAAAALAGAGALVLGVVVGAVAVLASGSAGSPDGRTGVAAAPASCEAVTAALRADVDGDGCDDAVEWRPAAAEIAYLGGSGEPLRFRVGQPGDELVLGDWDCDGAATAAVVRAATGETFLFDGWAGEGETLVAAPGPTLPVGTPARVVDDGGCDRIDPAAS